MARPGKDGTCAAPGPLLQVMAADKLILYQAKRDFTKTAEPSGKARVRAAEYLRFVVQKHAASRLHYDLRLEVDGVFKSWAVTKGPSLDPRDRRLAVEVEDHPLDYGDFEGTIPQGEYGGGTVMLWDRGFRAPDEGGHPERGLRTGDLKFTLAGAKLQGSWVLVRMRHDRERDRSNRNNWLLIKHRDGREREGGEPVTTTISGVRTQDGGDRRGQGSAPKALHARGQGCCIGRGLAFEPGGQVGQVISSEADPAAEAPLRTSEADAVKDAAVHRATAVQASEPPSCRR